MSSQAYMYLCKSSNANIVHTATWLLSYNGLRTIKGSHKHKEGAESTVLLKVAYKNRVAYLLIMTCTIDYLSET